VLPVKHYKFIMEADKLSRAFRPGAEIWRKYSEVFSGCKSDQYMVQVRALL
jgi:hypothetical protein